MVPPTIFVSGGIAVLHLCKEVYLKYKAVKRCVPNNAHNTALPSQHGMMVLSKVQVLHLEAAAYVGHSRLTFLQQNMSNMLLALIATECSHA